MRAAGHARLLVLAVVLWLAFLAGGWPAYYQQYSLRTQIIVCVVVTLAFALQGVRFIRPAKPDKRRARAVWLAFYMTVPFAALDAMYCGVHLGHGASFLVRYWYLTIFYVIPWLLFLPMGYLQAPQSCGHERQSSGGSHL